MINLTLKALSIALIATAAVIALGAALLYAVAGMLNSVAD